MPSPVRTFFVACAILLPGAAIVSFIASGCGSSCSEDPDCVNGHVAVPMYEASIPDTTVPPVQETGTGDVTADATNDATTMDGSPDAEVSEAGSSDASPDGGLDDGAPVDGASDGSASLDGAEGG